MLEMVWDRPFACVPVLSVSRVETRTSSSNASLSTRPHLCPLNILFFPTYRWFPTSATATLRSHTIPIPPQLSSSRPERPTNSAPAPTALPPALLPPSPSPPAPPFPVPLSVSLPLLNLTPTVQNHQPTSYHNDLLHNGLLHILHHPHFNLIVTSTSHPCSLPVSSKSILSRQSSSWPSHTSSTSCSALAQSLHHSSQFWITSLKSGSKRYSFCI